MQLPETYRSELGLTVAGASPELLAELLVALSFETRRLGAPIDDALQPGVSRQYVIDRLGELGLPAPEELITLWTWRNGTRPGMIGGQGLGLLPIESAVSIYPTDNLGDGHFSWHPAWITVLGPGNFSISVDTREVDHPPLVRSTDPARGTADDEPENQVVSLCTPVTWWVLARVKGWTHWERSTGIGVWLADRDMFPMEWWLTQVGNK